MTPEESLKSTLDTIAAGFGDLITHLEQPTDYRPMAKAFALAMQDVVIRAPSVTVEPAQPTNVINLPTSPAPVNNIQPSQVVVMPRSEVLGWKLTVLSRDGNNQIREMAFRPEIPGT